MIAAARAVVVALLTALLGLWSPSSLAWASPTVDVRLACTYDASCPHEASMHDRIERGPPTWALTTALAPAVDPGLNGSSARRAGAGSLSTTTYDDPASLVQVARATGTTNGHAKEIDGDLSSLLRWQVAANFGPKSLGAAQRLRYEGASYHGATNRGLKNAAPTNGQEALDFSTQIKATSPRRIGVDPDANEFVIFDQTVEGVFHGHARSWSELTGGMQSVLRKAGMVDRRGNIL